jgi:hypothetical protein
MAQPLIGISSPAGLNGMKMDWASVRTALFGTGMTASHMKDLSWNEAVTPTKPRGVHGIPLRRGLGFYTVTASATVTLEAHAAMIGQLPNGYTGQLSDASIAFQPYGSPIAYEVKWLEASIIGEDFSFSQGQGDGLWVKLNIDLRYVMKKGTDGVFKCMYPLDLDGAGISTGIT